VIVTFELKVIIGTSFVVAYFSLVAVLYFVVSEEPWTGTKRAHSLWNTNTVFFFFPMALRPNTGLGLLILEISRSHTTTRHSRQDSSGQVISSSQRTLPHNTQHLQQTNIHAPGGIRAHDLSRLAAADLRLRPRGCWDRHKYRL